MVIDFKVVESKTYSFFIEEEFCEIKMDRKGDKMFYTFEINKKIDTPRNRIRKKTNNKHLKQTLLFFGGMVLVAVLISIGLNIYKKRQVEKLYSAETNLPWTNAQIKELEAGSESTTLHYTFEAGGTLRAYTIDSARLQSNPMMPIREGDEFKVQYNPKYPYRHEIRLDQPSEDQLLRYLSRAVEKHLQLHPDMHPDLVICELEAVYNARGAEALGAYFHQNSTEEENEVFNRNTYLRLTRTPEIQKRIRENCY